MKASDHIIFENFPPPCTMRVQKTSFLKYVSREPRTRVLRLLLIVVFRSFFKSLPLCSIVPDGCTGDDIKIAWGYKKNKVRPRNKVDTGDNVMDRMGYRFLLEFLSFHINTFGNPLLATAASMASLRCTAATAYKANTYYGIMQVVSTTSSL